MELQQGEQAGDYLQSSSSMNKVLTLKSLISQILLINSAYDCMPINSVMCSIDKQVSFIKAIDIFISQGVDQLLVWDEAQSKWIWMLTVADIIRFLLYSIICIRQRRPIGTDVDISDFQHFQINKGEEMLEINNQELHQMIQVLNQKSLSKILEEFTRNQRGPGKFIRIKTAIKQSKLSFIVLTMITQKIHRIVIEDIDSKMMISVISFKDILLFLLRIANQSSTEVYSRVPIRSFLETNYIKDKYIHKDKKLIQAFRMMTEIHRSVWINVVDSDMQFCGVVFRRDFKEILKQWNLNLLWMTVGEYLKIKAEKNTSKIPEFRYFDLEDTTKEIIWKIVMSRKNIIVCLDKMTNRVIATIGLMQLFNLYVQYT